MTDYLFNLFSLITRESVNAVAGAALGASFYVLLKTQPYLVSRSYDPKYNAVYFARFITGLIAGVILATAIGPAFREKLGSGTGAALTPGILAILGGFAAEAVEQLLQRLVEVLLTLVRGDNSAQIQAKTVTAQAEKSAEVRAKLLDLERAKTDPERQAVLADLHASLKKPDSK
jgi:hypothetical protein